MRVAVLLSGQPRQLEQGAWWFKNRVFPPNKNIHVDYFCYFWDDGDPNLNTRIVNTYNPVRHFVQNYDSVINEFISKVQTYNNDNLDQLTHVPDKFREVHLFHSNEISNYAKNIWGQYLASDKMQKMVGDLKNYDIVIKTRSDVAFNNMEERFWLDSFKNIHRNPIFDDKMFAPWLYVDSGIPYFSDFAFISKPHVWHNFSKNIQEHCVKLATVDNKLWYELAVSDFPHHPHWIWNKLCGYSKTNMLSYSVVWPMPFDCKLIRYPDAVENMTFQSINQRFDQYARENPVK